MSATYPTAETDPTVAAAVEAHRADTSDVHGIADTSALATDAEVSAAVSAHSSDSTDVHGIADTSDLILEGDSRLSDDRDPTAHTHPQSDVTNLVADLAARQPLDSDLTAIAALTTTSFGRSVLEAANAGALRTLADAAAASHNHDASYQPLDSDLTSIAALSTTAYGRALLALADGNALRDLHTHDDRYYTEAEIDGRVTWGTLSARPAAGTADRLYRATDVGGMLFLDDGTQWIALTSGRWWSGVAASHTGNTSETILRTVTIPANAMGPNGWLRVTSHWSRTGANGNVNCVVKFGGSALLTSVALLTTNGGSRSELEVANRNDTASQVANAHSNFSTTGRFTLAPTYLTVDTTAPVDVTIAVNLANAADTGIVESYFLEVFHGA